MMPARAIDHHGALARVRLDADGLDPGRDRHAEAHDLVVEHGKEARAVNTETEEMRLKPPVIHNEHAAATGRAPLEIMDDGTEREHPRIEAELRKAGKTRRLQQQPRTNGARFGEALEQVHLVAGAREKGRGRKATRASPDDAYPEIPHGAHPG
jgi:hypothetical protein